MSGTSDLVLINFSIRTLRKSRLIVVKLSLVVIKMNFIQSNTSNIPKPLSPFQNFSI